MIEEITEILKIVYHNHLTVISGSRCVCNIYIRNNINTFDKKEISNIIKKVYFNEISIENAIDMLDFEKVDKSKKDRNDILKIYHKNIKNYQKLFENKDAIVTLYYFMIGEKRISEINKELYSYSNILRKDYNHYSALRYERFLLSRYIRKECGDVDNNIISELKKYIINK